jgi:hypothetical protein
VSPLNESFVKRRARLSVRGPMGRRPLRAQRARKKRPHRADPPAGDPYLPGCKRAVTPSRSSSGSIA